MTDQHPITPPSELIEDWIEVARPTPDRPPAPHILAILAAHWGSNRELEECCELTRAQYGYGAALELRADRRPMPLASLKKQALQALAHLENGAHYSMDTTESAHYIRRAIESLPD